MICSQKLKQTKCTRQEQANGMTSFVVYALRTRILPQIEAGKANNKIIKHLWTDYKLKSPFFIAFYQGVEAM